MNSRPFSAACERNKEPILAILREMLADKTRVLEIGSGTGQHAVHFARYLPHMLWQTSDLPGNHPGILAWMEAEPLCNVLPPLALDMNDPSWPAGPYDAVFTANTCHIMSWQQVQAMFRGIGRILAKDGVLCIYGPFNYRGRFTSASNARFDAMLKEQAPHMGIRDMEAVNELAREQGLAMLSDFEMPANNRLLVWRRC
ncbi:DUF938 domain-containing protein [Noviherbaspirillum massiliense]|uniref:DUF938 domain-containing protein n=1 Tax=Noviherbaspirillum massiliense TaxID=1465823 RepID=UPI000360F7CF|nr:DUF938 domain-containing protein [Noviherbaspirillum massiliense]